MSSLATALPGPVSPPIGDWTEDHIKAMSRRDRPFAIDLVVRRFEERLYVHAYCILKDGQEARDVVQEVFLQVHKSLVDFRNQSKFSTWLHRVTVNVVLMNRRAARDGARSRSGGPRGILAGRNEEGCGNGNELPCR